MKTVRQVLRAKGSDVWAIHPDATVLDALQLLAEKDIGALMVLKDNFLTGIFSERDYARKVILKGKHSKDTSIREVMSENPICVSPDQSIETCMTLMTENHVRHLPVVEDGRHLGLISIGDVVKAIISDQQGTIVDLENYITGRR
jgi:CBS domain-containing protein